MPTLPSSGWRGRAAGLSPRRASQYETVFQDSPNLIMEMKIGIRAVGNAEHVWGKSQMVGHPSKAPRRGGRLRRMVP